MNPWRGSNHSNQNLKLLSKLPVCTFCLFFHFHGLSYPQVKHSMLKCIDLQVDALLDAIVNQFRATFFPDLLCNLQQLRLKLNMVFPLSICHSIQVFKTFSVSPVQFRMLTKVFVILHEFHVMKYHFQPISSLILISERRLKQYKSAK